MSQLPAEQVDDELPSWRAMRRTSTATTPPSTPSTPPPSTPPPSAPPPATPPPPTGSTSPADDKKGSSPSSPPSAAVGVASAILFAGGIMGGVFLLNQGSLPNSAIESGTEQAYESTDLHDEWEPAPGGGTPERLALQDGYATFTTSTPPLQSTTSDTQFNGSELGASNESEPAVRIAIYSKGVIYLRGRVPTIEISTAIEERAASILGPDNVVNEYTIDPRVSFDPTEGSPLYVHDLLLFESGSAAIAEPFTPLLNLGATLMTTYPNVTITVIGHTDSSGSDEANLALSNARVQAVADYWAAAGIEPSRVLTASFGETSPLGDNTTAEGRRVNRRVEFVIAGLLAD